MDSFPLETRLSADAMAAHPLFPDIVAGYTGRLLASRRGDRLLSKILGQRERELLGFLLLCQHYEYLEGGAPPTLARLVAAEIGSPRRVAAFVAVLRVSGMLRSRASAEDRRTRILEPTPRLIALHRDWTRAACRQFDRLLEHPVLEAFLDAEPRFHRLACLLGAPEVFAKDSYWVSRYPLIAFFNVRRAGPFISASLAQAYCTAWQAGAAPPATIALPYGRLSRRLGVSRSHIFNAFSDAERAGLLCSQGAGRSIALSDRSVRDLIGYFADELAFIARHTVAAYGQLQARN
ncbi:hypothetical protein [Dongia sedimenti]|uniref:MarR family transcriptional regulator n=1 Tax=Dongia sedimenti TaxID=3064282 RepID=A0ABU0YXI0_9PROT|nr:hypothetical protein [Rhodospirillaceae bacterium R-7]